MKTILLVIDYSVLVVYLVKGIIGRTHILFLYAGGFLLLIKELNKMIVS